MIREPINSRVGCPFMESGEEVCHEGCLAARLSGEDRICKGSEFDPLNLQNEDS